MSLYHQNLAHAANQNVLLEANLQTLKKDFEEERDDLLKEIADLKEKYEETT